MKKLLVLLLGLTLTCQISFAGMSFDKVDDYIDLGSGTSVDDLDQQGGAGMTLAAWIYPLSSGESNAGAFICKADNGAANGAWWFQVNANGGGTTSFGFYKQVAGNDLFRESANLLLTLNTWQHVSVTWTGSTTATNIKLYLNGTEVSYGTNQNGGANDTDAAQILRIGNSDGTTTFEGRIEETAVWNVILTQAELTALASAKNRGIPAQIRPSALKMYCPIVEFAQGTTASGASTIKDYSGSGNHGTPTNSPTGQNGNLLAPGGLFMAG